MARFVFTLVAIVLFVLAANGVTIGDLSELRAVALGLMFFAVASLVP